MTTSSNERAYLRPPGQNPDAGWSKGRRGLASGAHWPHRQMTQPWSRQHCVPTAIMTGGCVRSGRNRQHYRLTDWNHSKPGGFHAANLANRRRNGGDRAGSTAASPQGRLLDTESRPPRLESLMTLSLCIHVHHDESWRSRQPANRGKVVSTQVGCSHK